MMETETRMMTMMVIGHEKEKEKKRRGRKEEEEKHDQMNEFLRWFDFFSLFLFLHHPFLDYPCLGLHHRRHRHHD